MVSRLLEVDCTRCHGNGTVVVTDKRVGAVIVVCSCAAGRAVARIDAGDWPGLAREIGSRRG